MANIWNSSLSDLEFHYRVRNATDEEKKELVEIFGCCDYGSFVVKDVEGDIKECSTGVSPIPDMAAVHGPLLRLRHAYVTVKKVFGIGTSSSFQRFMWRMQAEAPHAYTNGGVLAAAAGRRWRRDKERLRTLTSGWRRI